jgi:hypothetical protein
MATYRIKLTKEEVSELQKIVHKGSHSTQTYRAAYILLNVDEGNFSIGKNTNARICSVLKISHRTIDRVKKKIIEKGMDAALERDKGCRIYEKKIDGDVEAKLIATACSEPPKGYAKWSLRLLADRMVEMQYIDSLSHVSVGKVLKKTNLSRGK